MASARMAHLRPGGAAPAAGRALARVRAPMAQGPLGRTRGPAAWGRRADHDGAQDGSQTDGTAFALHGSDDPWGRIASRGASFAPRGGPPTYDGSQKRGDRMKATAVTMGVLFAACFGCAAKDGDAGDSETEGIDPAD